MSFALHPQETNHQNRKINHSIVHSEVKARIKSKINMLRFEVQCFFSYRRGESKSVTQLMPGGIMESFDQGFWCFFKKVILGIFTCHSCQMLLQIPGCVA